jgi:hypothetical protein
MNLTSKLLFVAILFSVYAQAQNISGTVALQRWTDSIPQEKAYLHMDKPYYALGDTIWFKGYLTAGSRHQLSARSAAIYVDLINEQNQPVRTLKLPADSGLVAGSLVLEEDIKQGSYTLRAYTQWMRNAAEEYFFYKTFTVGDPNAKIPAATVANKKVINATLPQTDIQFFPESGNLINGLASRVGFKAVGPDGLGQAISGTITDSRNIVVAQFSTLHAGMGSFMLKPEAGKTYTANIKFTDGTTKTAELPVALNQGYVLSVYQSIRDVITVRIGASAALQNTTVNLIVHSGGELIFSETVLLNKAVTTVSLEKGTFPSGIAQFTLFDANNEPLNERIAFIKNNDHMRLAISAPKTVYKSKEQVRLELSARQSGGMPTAANFSVAVTDESKTPVEENAESTIFSNILLNSDLKGYVEKSNYYFSADTGNINKALDNLMLTQGYRRFEWKLLLDTASIRPVFPAERMGTTISGTVKTLTHKPMPNAAVLMVSTNARINKTTITDENGKFRFDNLIFADSARFSVQARNAKNTDHAIIAIDSLPRVVITNKVNLAEVNIIKANLQKAVQDGKPIKLTGRLLKQVNIKATKKVDEGLVPPQGGIVIAEVSADKVIIMSDPEIYPNLAIFLNGRFASFRVETSSVDGRNSLVGTRPPLTGSSAPSEVGIILNGRRLVTPDEVDELLRFTPVEDIAKIWVVTRNFAVTRLYGEALFIFTKPPSARKQYNPSIANIKPKGFNKARKFYSPRYDKPNDSAAKLPDQRTTIFWDPYVNTDMNGRTTIDFFNADGPGTYRVVVEGINAVGELGRQVFRYKVEQ